jgi:DNA-binding beta-propeller fold protein YncE
MNQVFAALLTLAGLVFAQEPKALRLNARMDLAGVTGRIDHLSVDLKGQRIFVAALGNQTLEVLDVTSGRRLHTIANLAEPQGVYYDPSSNRLFVACRKDGTVRLFDAESYQLLQTVKFSGDADNVRYDSRDRRILVGYGDGALGLIDPAGKKLADIPLDAHPESFQLEQTGARAFVNVPDRKQIEVVDLARKAVVAKWPVTSALNNYPMALDEKHHRLLIGCRAPARMLVFDTQSGRQTASLEIAGDADDLFYDAARSRVYVIGGEGFVDVLEQKSADQYRRIDHIATAPGARTGLFAPDWGKLFVAAPHRAGRHAEILVYVARTGDG